MRRVMIWLLAGTIAVGVTVLSFLPAAWMSPILERQTGGRVSLGDAQGTLWNGSAFIGGAPGGNDPLTPLVPGRFAWRLSPAVLIGRVSVDVDNPSALAQPVKITGSWSQWQISPSQIMVTADRLAGLGAPLNTIQLSGQMRLSWGVLQLVRQGNRVDLTGSLNLQMDDMASRLSPIKPLGAYQLVMDWQGQQASAVLKTVKGPMMLSGTGMLSNGRMQFSGKAEAAPGQEERLANLLNLLGQRRKEGNRDVIALEFR
ncbi:MAG: type II secretion system protein N [Herminiimonas sp.]|nr:type II secretion system protein N [Herminiimonas sp.]